MAKDSFVLYTKQMVAIANVMDDALLGGLLRLILAYENGEECEPSAELAIAWALIRQQLQANDEKYLRISEMRKENGRKGGLAKQMVANATKSQANNGKRSYNDNDNDNDNDYRKTISKDIAKRFAKPSLDEVTAYCAERGNKVSAKDFLDFYESKGWKVGNSPMKDWKAAVRTWENRRKASATITNVNDFRDAY